MTHVSGVLLIDVTRARNGWIWTSRHMRHCVSPGTAITDDDTNEETRPAAERCPGDLNLVLNGVLTHSAETLIQPRPNTPRCEERSSAMRTVFCKSIKHLFTLRTTRRTWSTR
jgi:hypothetical protein